LYPLSVITQNYWFIMLHQWQELLSYVCEGTMDLMNLGFYLRWWLI